jgi:microcystin-dependent protein
MSTPFLGEIKIVSFNFPPRGWAFCNGQLLPINQNQALFSILGTTYGGNGTVNFALPDLQGRVPVHVGQGITLGQRAGEAAHTLNISELPAHNHPVASSPELTNSSDPAGRVVAARPRGGMNIYATPPTSTAMSAASVAATGGGQPHENLMPYLVLNYVIALQGIFPSRN